MPDERSSASDVAPTGLGASVRARIEAGLADGRDLDQVFAEADEMVGGEDPADAEDRIEVDGNLRPLIAEYLWETDAGKTADADVLEQMVAIQYEAPVPHMDLDGMGLGDVLRLMMQTYLSSAPGERTARVGEVFAVLERFFHWAIRTQGFDLQPLLDGVREGFVDHVPRLEAAGLALSSNQTVDDHARALYRVVSVSQDSFEIVAEEGDTLVQVPAPPGCVDQLQAEDLILAAVRETEAGQAHFTGLVLVMPPVARNLLG